MTRRLQEQYLIEQLEVIVDNGVTVVIPPIFNDVFTAKLKATTTWTTAALKAAKTRVENALAKVESPYPDTAAGLTIVVGWGLPYFRDVIGPTLSNKYLPAVPAPRPKQFAVRGRDPVPERPGHASRSRTTTSCSSSAATRRPSWRRSEARCSRTRTAAPTSATCST